jgi:hypothetical protein
MCRIGVPSERSDAPQVLVVLSRGFGCSFRRAFAHGLPLEGDLIRVMNEKVENGIGQGGMPNGVMPVLNWELTGDNRGAGAVAIFEDFEQIVAVVLTEWRSAEVIQDQQIDLDPTGREFGIAAIAFGDGEVAPEAWQAQVVSGIALAIGSMG